MRSGGCLGCSVWGCWRRWGIATCGGRGTGGERASTWEGPRGEGRRIDAAHASEGLSDAIASAEHVDAPRESGHSDHSAVVVEILDETGGRPGAERKNP